MPSHQSHELLIKLLGDVLEMIARGEPALAVADLLCRRAETFAPEAMCSILEVVDGALRPLAAPSLPGYYSAALDGIQIGPSVGSCGTAAFRGEAVTVADIANDPLWAEYRTMALPIGLRACWSTPIKSRDGAVVGTFAFYFREPRGPNELEREIVARCTHLCAVIIEHDQVQQRAHYLAYVDALSNLPNRASFDRRLSKAIDDDDLPFALLFADLDHLKVVNDTLGHVAGDALIRTVAKRLASVSPTVEIFRLGGDEFAVIVDPCRTNAEMSEIASSLIAAVCKPLDYDGLMIEPSLTAGGVLRQGSSNDAKTLCQNADFALYHAKAMSRGGFVAFEEGMRTAIVQRLGAIADLGDALADNRVTAHYQPIVRLDTGEIVGLEALARIRTIDGRIVPAGKFAEALRDPRIAYQLSDRMLSQVVNDLGCWLRQGIAFQHVGFNVTTADFQKGDLEKRITAAFSAADVPLDHLILEVNELVFMNDEKVASEIGRLRDMGIKVALDDFGTGFAALTHLLNFPVDVIKIDKSFVDKLHEPQGGIIIDAIIEVAKKLNMKIVAEGIETSAQAERLIELGCQLGQGFHFAKSASSSVTTELLRLFGQRSKVESQFSARRAN